MKNAFFRENDIENFTFPKPGQVFVTGKVIKFHKKILPVFALLLYSLTPFGVNSQSRINNKLTDFGILNYPDRKIKFIPPEPKKERMDGQKLGKIFASVSITKTTQQIDLSKRNVIIGIRGTRLTIAAGTFQYSDYLTAKGAATVHVYEVMDTFDYMIAGVYHIYQDTGKSPVHMELGGMVRFEIFQGNSRLRMSGEYPILVDFPLLYPEKKFNLYYLNQEGIWVKKVDHGLYDIYPSLTTEAEGKKLKGVRQFKMNAPGWWSFGSPVRDLGVVKGKIDGTTLTGNTPIHAVSIPKNFCGYIGKWVRGGEYSIPLFPYGSSRIVFSDDDGNLGVTEFFDASGRLGVDTSPESVDNFFQEVPPTLLKASPGELFGNEERIREFLGLVREEFQVVYPSK